MHSDKILAGTHQLVSDTFSDALVDHEREKEYDQFRAHSSLRYRPPALEAS